MSKWLSAGEVENIITKIENSQKLFQLYGLSLFSHYALYTKDFEPDVKWKECIVLTKYAKDCLVHLHKNGMSCSEEYEAFALFQLFYHHDLFIDYIQTDVDNIILLLSDLHKNNKAKWPYIFGNQLYNKFNDTNHDTRTEDLDADKTDELLRDTPQGIFQVGKIVSGPLGFLESRECRVLPPTKKILLWHCSDPGCGQGHLVTLHQHKSTYKKAADFIRRHILDNFGPESEWKGLILHSYRKGKWPNGRPFCDLPAIIGECIIGEERTRLLVRCLESPYNSLLTTAIHKTRSLQDHPEKIASTLTQEEKHQLLLLLNDKDLVNYIDELIVLKEIDIPPAELRNCKTIVYRESARDAKSRLSSLGIRSIGHDPIIELVATVWLTYESLGLSNDLLWCLRRHETSSIRHSVMDFVKIHGPEQTVRELILTSRPVITAIAEKYVFQIFKAEDEELTIKRLLWKMGFNPARYEDEYCLFRNRISEFQECIIQMGLEPTENEKSKVRSFGVNLFISVETFLENLLCYNVWLMASDHFTTTGFLYSRDDAHATVIRVLGKDIISGTEKFTWSIDGFNTLGCLLAYLQTFRNWLKQRQNIDKHSVSRKPEDYPHYAKDTLCVFPFKHIELWADTSSEMMAAYYDLFEKICIQIGQADLATIRNAIDHKREDKFPSGDKMLACVSRLKQVFEIADSGRLIPKLFWGMKSESDSWGNICDTFCDYYGKSVLLWEPSVILGGPKKNFGIPYLIAPFDFMNQPNSILVFGISAPSEYKRYWKGYPRRRFIPSDAEQKASESIDGFIV